MKRMLTFFTAGVSILVNAAPASPCTAFSVKNSNGRQVAKNFDWYIGDGLVVVNPRGVRRSQAQKTNGKPVEWVSKYGSVSLTTFAPGFPVSGMNEEGLVVESLHHTNFRRRLQTGEGLVSLEWVQYVLDRCQSVAEVKQFAAQNGFGQAIIPLHFFVTDAFGNSLVVYGQLDQIQMISGKQLPIPVLANNHYFKDLAKYRNLKKRTWLQRLFSPDDDGGRFGIIAKGLNVLPSDDAVFKLLHAARIPTLTQWQILWNQTHKSLRWRSFENRRPKKRARIDFRQLDFSCRPQPLVSDTRSDAGVHFAPYSAVDQTQATVRTQAIESALGKKLPEEIVTAFGKPLKCAFENVHVNNAHSILGE
ncbi:MAG: linear amide C-N hydrolase [Deltaproteobacteria bacterium]|nr:linear amide C-N hydrolase [Deltaproteobacteria bacterium]